MRRSATMHKKNTLLAGLRSPLAANFQAVSGQNFADLLRSVTIREEKPDGFAAPELEASAVHFDLPRAGERKPCDNALQIKPAVFNGKTQFAVFFFNAQIEQKRHQPVARWSIVVLRQNLFDSGGVICPRRKIGAEQQKIVFANERHQLRQNLFRLEVGNHAKESDEVRGARRKARFENNR